MECSSHRVGVRGRNSLQPMRQGAPGRRALQSAQQLEPSKFQAFHLRLRTSDQQQQTEWSAVLLFIKEHLPRIPVVTVAGASETWPRPQTALGQSANEEGRDGDQAHQARLCGGRAELN